MSVLVWRWAQNGIGIICERICDQSKISEKDLARKARVGPSWHGSFRDNKRGDIARVEHLGTAQNNSLDRRSNPDR